MEKRDGEREKVGLESQVHAEYGQDQINEEYVLNW